MKKYITNNCFLFLVSLTLLLTSCNIEDDSTAVIPFVPGEVENPVTISQIIIADPNLSILEDALRIVEAETDFKLITDLNIPGGSTIFAPSNEAFTQFLTANGVNSIEDVDIDDLAELLLNHVLTTEITAENFQSGYVTTSFVNTDTEANVNMYVNTAASNVVLNGGSTVVTPNIEANNGVIHIVDNVINIATVATFVAQDPNLSGFNAAVLGQGLRGIVGAGANRTAFVPNNVAFNAYVETSGLGEMPSELEVLNFGRILINHIVVDDLTASELVRISTRRNPFTEENLLEEDLSFNVTTAVDGMSEDGEDILVLESFTVTDPLGNVVTTDDEFIDIQASNGTMHVINGVLQAAPLDELPVVEE